MNNPPRRGAVVLWVSPWDGSFHTVKVESTGTRLGTEGAYVRCQDDACRHKPAFFAGLECLHRAVKTAVPKG